MNPKKIVAFGASSSKHSINKTFATYAAHQIKEASVNLLDLNDFEMTIFSVDKEKAMLDKDGKFPALAYQFKEQLKESDGIVISFAEHNGAYTSAFKNIFDWISRIEKDIWYNKPMLLLATSPGLRGGSTVLDLAVNKLKFMNNNVLIPFSLPSFYDNFNEQEGIKNPELNKMFQEKIIKFQTAL